MEPLTRDEIVWAAVIAGGAFIGTILALTAARMAGWL